MRIGDQTGQDVDQVVRRTAVEGVLDLGTFLSWSMMVPINERFRCMSLSHKGSCFSRMFLRRPVTKRRSCCSRSLVTVNPAALSGGVASHIHTVRGRVTGDFGDTSAVARGSGGRWPVRVARMTWRA